MLHTKLIVATTLIEYRVTQSDNHHLLTHVRLLLVSLVLNCDVKINSGLVRSPYPLPRTMSSRLFSHNRLVLFGPQKVITEAEDWIRSRSNNFRIYKLKNMLQF